MMNKTQILFLLALGAPVVRAFALPADEPIFQLRLRMPDVRSDAAWASTFGIIRENPGCCDEVWFSTGIGYPPLASTPSGPSA